MSTVIPNIFTINGVVDTSKTVMDNINILANACLSWVTFDIHTGKWTIVVNQPGSSVASFNDSNIIGAINISGTGISELYNRVQIQFPHKDLNDEVDVITYEVAEANRFPYELDNTLNFEFDCINDPTQAEYLAVVALKQSRVDKVIQFRTDYTRIGVKAGDIIDVTSSMYGYTNKKFRVLNISEDDIEDYNLVISITAFEYDADIYSSAGLIRTERNIQNGIVTKCVNEEVQKSDDEEFEDSLIRMLIPLAIGPLFNWIFPMLNKLFTQLVNTPDITVTIDPNKVCEGNPVVVTVKVCCPECAKLSGLKVPYEITGVSQSDIGVPLKGEISVDDGGNGTLTIPTIRDNIPDGPEYMTVKVGDYSEVVEIIDYTAYFMTASPSVIDEGGTSIITINTVGIPDSTAKPFRLSGSGLSQLPNQPTEGKVIIKNNQAQLTLVTTDIRGSSDKSITVEFDPDTFYCEGEPITITMLHKGDVIPPPPPPETCDWIAIPLDWCGQFDSETGKMIAIAPASTIQVLKEIPGQPSLTVPMTANVLSNGQIQVTSTEKIDANFNRGGLSARVITQFNPVTPGVKRVTGTTVEIRGH